jgi:hypothetical protein
LWRYTPLAKIIEYFKKESKMFELSPQSGLKKLCIVFSFMKEREIKNPPKYIPST